MLANIGVTLIVVVFCIKFVRFMRHHPDRNYYEDLFWVLLCVALMGVVLLRVWGPAIKTLFHKWW